MILGEGNPAAAFAAEEEIARCAAAIQRQRMQEFDDAAEQAAAVSGEPVERMNPFDVPDIECTVCGDTVRYPDGFKDLYAPSCISTGSCEDIWTKFYPDKYADNTGVPVASVLPCRGYRCKAVLKLSRNTCSSPNVSVVGVCAVDAAGEHWRTTGRAELDKMKATPIREDEIEDDSVSMGGDPTA